MLFDGTEAHGLFEITVPLEMWCSGSWSDFLSSDAIATVFDEEILDGYNVSHSIIIPSKAELAYCSVRHFDLARNIVA